MEFGQTDPGTRGPVVSLLLQLYMDSKSEGQKEHQGDDVNIPSGFHAIADMAYLFITYVLEAEHDHGGDFEAWLRRAALDAHLAAAGGPDLGADVMTSRRQDA